MTNATNNKWEVIILIFLLIVLMALDLTDIFFIGDGSFPYVWLGFAIGGILRVLLRKEKPFEILALPIAFIVNYILYRIGIYIPNRMMLYFILAGLIIHFIRRASSKWKSYEITAVILLLTGFLVVNYNIYSNRIIKDRGLNSLIKNEFEIEENITEEDLVNIEKLIIHDDDNVVSLNDIHLLKNLKRLYFSDGNTIIDYSPISNLGNLEKLTIWYMDLNKLKQIKHIDSLKHLELIYPKKGEIHDLENFPNITTLELQGVRLTDLSILKGPEYLETLHISDCELTNFKGIEIFPDIKSLSFYKLDINAFDDIFKLKDLKEINLQYVQIKDYDRFKDLADSKGIIVINR
ncbi:hypothetical protein [Sedimentibacter sp.]|uniref:hypothetical protein n=1 Tax=Sedimentibacter sp. TaxID=1960295 RepID=UPI0028A1B12A|nr:hypothetical protein [Sedimentibacter sp.]